MYFPMNLFFFLFFFLFFDCSFSIYAGGMRKCLQYDRCSKCKRMRENRLGLHERIDFPFLFLAFLYTVIVSKVKVGSIYISLHMYILHIMQLLSLRILICHYLCMHVCMRKIKVLYYT